MKRFAWVALFASAMIVCVTATARAGGNTVKLTPPPGSDFPNAYGLVSTTYDGPYYTYVWDGWGNWIRIRYYQRNATFQVWKLAPKTNYVFTDGAFTTDASGNASGTGSRDVGDKKPPSYEVYYWVDQFKVVVLW